MTLAELRDEVLMWHSGQHSCTGMDPIMGYGHRNFGIPKDGVLCDAYRLATALSPENVAVGLGMVGYPPVKMVRAAGPSAHFEHDNAAFAAALLQAIPIDTVVLAIGAGGECRSDD